MAHYAYLDDNNIVTLVFVGRDENDTTSFSKPNIAAIVEGSASQAACMASALLETSFKPSSKAKTPAAVNAEISPKE